MYKYCEYQNIWNKRKKNIKYNISGGLIVKKAGIYTFLHFEENVCGKNEKL